MDPVSTPLPDEQSDPYWKLRPLGPTPDDELCKCESVDHGALRLSFYHCTPADPATLPLGNFGWVEAAALASLKFPPANAAVLEAIANRHAVKPRSLIPDA